MRSSSNPHLYFSKVFFYRVATSSMSILLSDNFGFCAQKANNLTRIFSADNDTAEILNSRPQLVGSKLKVCQQIARNETSLQFQAFASICHNQSFRISSLFRPVSWFQLVNTQWPGVQFVNSLLNKATSQHIYFKHSKILWKWNLCFHFEFGW